MITKKSNTFTSCDGITKIHVSMWCPDTEEYKEPTAILQLCHGMIDYIDRYDAVATFMAKRGILVVGNDHLGHGKSVNSNEDLGYFSEEHPEQSLVTDAHHLTKLIKKMYPDTPYFLAGHSMGSFMVRKYITQFGDELDGVVVLGTGHQADIMIKPGLMLVNIIGKLKGERFRSKLLAKILFMGYNKRIKPLRTVNDWLTRDTEVVDKYCADPLNSFIFTVNGYKGMLKTILYIKKKENIKKIPQHLPMLMMSGLEDPVGEYGNAVKKAFKTYHEWLDDTDLVLYEDCRHELCGELNKEEIFEDMYEWISNHIQ